MLEQAKQLLLPRYQHHAVPVTNFPFGKDPIPNSSNGVAYPRSVCVDCCFSLAIQLNIHDPAVQPNHTVYRLTIKKLVPTPDNLIVV